MKDGGLYPALDVPAIGPGSGNVTPGQTITLTNPNTAGVIYFTLDGSDPREIGGVIAEGAKLYTQPFLLGPLKQLKARIKDGETWSALAEAQYENAQDFSALQITEIGYGFRSNPNPGDDYDFIELKNAGATPLDLTGLLFEQGVTYAFPAGTMLAPGAFYVIGRNAQRFAEAHPGQTLDGIFTGRLSDTGEDLVISAGSGVPLISLHYSTELPWPPAGALGFTIVRADDGNPNNGKNWRASTNPGGSPHADDPAPPLIPRIVVNEVWTGPDASPDMTELLNLDAVSADISGWWLSRDPSDPKQARIPDGTVILPGAFLALNLLDLPATGGAAYVFSANPAGDLTGYAHGFDYGPAPEGRNFGRLVNSDGEEKFPTFGSATPGDANGLPAGYGVVINEINYHPAPGDDEFVELRNRGKKAESLAGRKLDGFGFTFPADAIIAPYALALVVNTDPAAFRMKYAVPSDVAIYGGATGILQDDGERIAVLNPFIYAGVPGTFYETLESVRYNDKSPWPWDAAGFGASLQRPVHAPFADDPASWLAAAPTPGLANTVNAAPEVTLTSPLVGASITPPAAITFTADANDPDGTIAKVEFLSDSVVVGESTGAPFSFAWTGADPGQHDLTARATDNSGNVTESDSVGVFVENPEAGTGRGLLGEYFTNQELDGSAATSRADGPIDFEWSDIDPAPGVSRANFSVRWTGKYVPQASGETQLNVHAAGGVRLFLDGELLIDEWANEEPLDFFATFNAVAGQPVAVRLEYRDGDGFAEIQLGTSDPRFFGQKPLPLDALYSPTQDPAAFAISTPTTLPTAQVGVPYRLQFKTAHGVNPVTFKIEFVEFAFYPGFNQSIPTGLSLSNAGILSGTPSQTGRYGIFVTGTDGTGRTTVISPGDPFFITVLPAGPPVRPVLTVTGPIERAKLVGDLVNLVGAASSDRGIQRVEYALNGGPWRPLTLTAKPLVSGQPQTVTFATNLDDHRGLFAGENTLLVRAVDSDGVTSRIVTRRFSLRQFALLTVEVQGAGAVSPEFLGTTRREVGKTYTVRATPGRGHILKWWQEGEFGGNPASTFTFTMYRGLKLTAVFIPNPFPALAGTYVTAVGTELDRSDARGVLGFNLTRTGAFTAMLRLGGRNYPFTGRFDALGFYFKQLDGGGIILDQARPLDVRPPFFGGLNISLNVDFEAGTIVANIDRWNENDSFSLSRTLQRSRWGEVSRPPCPLAGHWSMVVAPGGDGQPACSGFAHLEIGANGRAKLSGTLADGTPWNTASRVDDNLVLPLYNPFYGGAGSFSGELHFVAENDPVGSGDFFWQKPPDLAGTAFPDGFAFHATVEVAPYTRPAANAPLVPWTLGDCVIRDVAGETALTFPVVAGVNYDVRGKFSSAPAESLLPADFQVIGNRATGVLRGALRERGTNKLRRLNGIIDQRTGTIYGSILATPTPQLFEIREHTMNIPFANP
jgi:hypothetical protein